MRQRSFCFTGWGWSDKNHQKVKRGAMTIQTIWKQKPAANEYGGPIMSCRKNFCGRFSHKILPNNETNRNECKATRSDLQERMS